MDWTKFIKIIFSIVYFVGVIIVLCLVCISLFGPTDAIYPDAMIPYSWKESAFIWLAMGGIPMFLACVAFYKVNVKKNAAHKMRIFALIFLPSFICLCCVLYIVGIIIVGMINVVSNLR